VKHGAVFASQGTKLIEFYAFRGTKRFKVSVTSQGTQILNKGIGGRRPYVAAKRRLGARGVNHQQVIVKVYQTKCKNRDEFMNFIVRVIASVIYK